MKSARLIAVCKRSLNVALDNANSFYRHAMATSEDENTQESIFPYMHILNCSRLHAMTMYKGV